jgi:hypothetical protein
MQVLGARSSDELGSPKGRANNEAPAEQASKQKRSPSPVSSQQGAWLLAVCIVMTAIPVQMNFGFLAQPIPLYNVAYIVTAIRLMAGYAAEHLRRRGARPSGEGRRQPPLLAGSIGLFVAAVLAVFVVHPSLDAALIVCEIFGVLVVARRTQQLIDSHRATVLIRTVSGWVLVQFPIAVAQVINDGAVFGKWASESEKGFRRINGMLGAAGTVIFANVLGTACALASTFLLIALVRHKMATVDRIACGAALSASAAMVGLTLSRTAIVAQVIILVTAVVARERRRLAPALLAAFIALAGSMAVRSDGWVARGQASVAGAEAAGSGRMALNRQAIEVFKTSPVVGVGLDNYERTVNATPEIEALSEEHLLVHNFALYVLATGGVVGSIATLVIGLVVAVRSLRHRNGTAMWSVGVLAVVGSVMMTSPHFHVGVGFMWLGLLLGLLNPLADLRRGVKQANPSR